MNEQTRTYNSARNVLMGFVSRLVLILLTFVGRRIFLQVLTLDYLGINGLFSDVLSMLSLADLGLATAMSYSFYKPLAERDEEKLAALVGFYRKAYGMVAVVVACAGLAVVPFLRYIVNVQQEIPYLELYYLISLANTVISYLFVYKSSMISADQNGYLISKYTIWISAARLALQTVILYTTHSYLLYCAVTIITTLINNAILSRKADRMYPFIRRKQPLDKEERTSIFANIKSVLVYKIAWVMLSGTDSILISVLVGTAFVGMYSNYSVTVSNLSHLAGILFFTLSPSLGNLAVKERPQRRHEVFHLTQTICFWVSGFFIFCLYFLMDDFVVLWLGPEYIFDATTRIIILLNFYVVLLLQPTVAFREACGLYRKTKYATAACAALNIALSIPLGRRMGVAGIVLATFVARLVTYAWYEPVVLFRDVFQTRIAPFARDVLLHFLLLTGCIVLAEAALPAFTPASWLQWLIKACVCGVAINLVYLARYFRSDELRAIRERVRHMIRSRGD